MAIEEEFGVDIPNADAENLVLVGDVYRFSCLSDKTLTMRELVSLLITLNSEALHPQIDTEEEVWRRLVDVFVRQLNVNRDEVVPEASITRDLGAD